MKQSRSGVGALQKVADGIGKIMGPVNKNLMTLSSIISLVMASLMCIDILLRTFLNAPILGLIEMETIMLAALFFLSLPFTTSKNGHVNIDLLERKFSMNVKIFVGVVFSVLSLYFFGIITWQYVVRALEAFHSGEATEINTIPMYPFYLLVSFGCALTGVVLIQKMFEILDVLVNTFRNVGVSALLAFLTVAVVILIPPIMKAIPMSMDAFSIGTIILSFMLVLMLIGFPIAFTMGVIGVIGIWYLADIDIALGVIRMSVYESASNYFFCVLPFFILMGFLTLKAGISGYLYSAAQKWFGFLPGGLSIATVVGCGGFAAICGDSLATAATMGSVSLPEMKKYKYDDSLATGSVAAGGTLGILIPPSVGFVIYAMLTEESVGKLFMAGFLPGIFLITIFSLYIYLRCKINPAFGPKAPRVSFSQRLRSLKEVWTVVLLFVIVIGGIYLGYFTPTEAGAVGVIGALIISLTYTEFSWRGFVDALFSSIQMTAMIFTILVGVNILGYFVTLTGIPFKLAGLISDLNVSRYVIFGLILLLYLILGMLMNIVPMIMITLPILFPVVISLGFDPIWFGVIMVIMMEMGQITPPVGINVYIISGVAKDVPMSTIFKGILPFALLEIIVIVILSLFPQIVMLLPNTMEVLPSIGN